MGFVQEPYGALCTRIRELDTPSVSLHSSPTSVLRSLSIGSHSNPSSPTHQAEPGENQEGDLCEVGERPQSGNTGNYSGSELGGILGGASPAASPVSEEDLERSKEASNDNSPCQNNSKDREERSRRQRADGE